ncbi:SDR family NAD(P)-dependent oxidoreductase [Aspergillus affinis]|uniref:SDR family NAD(P)-dependent oxidoreductase n=1 Tax=Aspergillus affinis TaxID=1070780 RepID=UPI0022FDCF15|nr:3-oxoacyl-reductase [Aspergillus affinis]KAI9037484.1 3-oxoacyl-reductase [Aspergillus affinis]
MDATSSVTSLFDVKGVVAVITGGGSGLGLFMTRALAANGAKNVYILGRRKDVLDRAASEFEQGNVIPVQCDVTDRDEPKAAVQFIKQDIGYINVLIANSGIAGPSLDVPAGANIAQVQEALLKIPMQEFTNTFHVNCTATFYTAIAFLGLLDAGNQNNTYPQGRSQVIAMSSIASFNWRVTAGFAYGTSKSATTLMFKILATYLAPYQIRANILCPRYGKNATGEGAFPADQIPAERAGMPKI